MSPRTRRTDDGRQDDDDNGSAGDDGGGESTLEEFIAEYRSDREEMGRRLEQLESRPARAQRDTSSGRGTGGERDLEKALRAAGFDDLTEDDLRDLRAGKRRSEIEGVLDDWLERRGAELAAEADAAQEGDGKGKSKPKSSSAGSRKKTDDDTGGEGDGDGEGRGGGYFGR